MFDELFGIVVKLFFLDFGDVYFLVFLIIVFAVVMSFVLVQVLFFVVSSLLIPENQNQVSSPCCSWTREPSGGAVSRVCNRRCRVSVIDGTGNSGIPKQIPFNVIGSRPYSRPSTSSSL